MQSTTKSNKAEFLEEIQPYLAKLSPDPTKDTSREEHFLWIGWLTHQKFMDKKRVKENEERVRSDSQEL